MAQAMLLRLATPSTSACLPSSSTSFLLKHAHQLRQVSTQHSSLAFNWNDLLTRPRPSLIRLSELARALRRGDDGIQYRGAKSPTLERVNAGDGRAGRRGDHLLHQRRMAPGRLHHLSGTEDRLKSECG